MGGPSRGARRLRALAALVVFVAGAVGGARRAAAEESAEPWFPMMDPEKDPDEILEMNALAVIRVGENGWRTNRGKYRESVSRHDFFVTVGRTDLASSESSSNATSTIVTWAGWGAFGTGVVLLYAHVAEGGIDPPLWLGLSLAGGGLVAAMVGPFIHGPTLTPEEAEGLARRYNEQLKDHIEHEAGRKQPTQAFAPTVAPWVDGRSGFGLAATARF